MKISDLRRYYIKLVDAISFSPELYRFRRELNARIDAPDTIVIGMHSHPFGVSRWFKKRRISIAEAYLMVIRDLESKQVKARLRALRMMMDVSLHAKTLDLPLNTARVQMALIKEAIKHRNNKRRQLELLADFTLSTHGQNQVIRKLLDELNIIELPETGQRLKDLDAGRDGHVHDSATSGRKNPTRLLIDAFIKGISSLTIAHSSASSLDLMEEAIDAGRIVGIRVDIGLELSIYFQGKRFHFMALLPTFKNGKEAHHWFRNHQDNLKELFDGLERNQLNRIEAVRDLLHHFNEHFLPLINEGYTEDSLYALPRLKMKKLAAAMHLASINRTQLGNFLYSCYKPVLFRRILLLKVSREKALCDFRKRLIAETQYRSIDDRYARLRKEFSELSPDNLNKQYFANPAIGDYQTVFLDMKRIKAMISGTGCVLRVLHPLEHGLGSARDLLEKGRGIIDQVEVYNMRDSVGRSPGELLELANLVNELNTRSGTEGKPVYVSACGSDSTGRSPNVPGMGFIREDRLIGKYRRRYGKRHIRLPTLVSALIEAGGKPVTADAARTAPTILSMGKVSAGAPNLVGDENATAVVPLRKVSRYLNPLLVNLAYALIGFAVATHFIGYFYAFLWLFITGFRNSIADLVAGRGTRLSEWHLKSINFGNVSRSLFWTGFSVPILGFVKERFDVIWPWETTGFLFNGVKFFFISFSNGLYLATHNTLRGFDRKVVKANFFRSVIAWPFATVFAPVGSLLGIPSIVQAKIWSDFVAGFIEGGDKYLKVLRLRRRDLAEIVPLVVSEDEDDRFTALLDLLFLFREEPRTRNSLKTVLDPGYRPMGLIKLDTDTRASSLEQLRESVMDEHLDQALLNFILVRNTPEVSAELMDLVVRTLPAFRDWIGPGNSLKAKRGGSK